MTIPKKHYRACNLCEAICGLEITYEGNEVLTITGDKNDPFSRGHICPKAVALKDIYEDPNRLRQPVKRTLDGWVKISWQEALDTVADRLRAVRNQYGADAVGLYAGNPSVHNSGTFLTGGGLIRALGSKNIFSATTADQVPHHFAGWAMFGHPLLLPIPDLDHTHFWLIMGGNPIASNGSLMTAPDVANRLKAIQERGGKVVVVDPRFTETAAKADAHHFVRPGSDVFLLLAMIHTLFAEKLFAVDKLPTYIVDVENLRQIVENYSPESVASHTGMEAEAIRTLTREFAAAPSAIAYGRIGLSTQAFGGLCQWLLNSLNILTGNLDKPGGVLFTQPALDIVGNQKKPYDKHNRWQSRVRGLPEFMGELPVSALAEEMLTPGEGQIKALVTNCGNPVLSTPNGQQVDEALANLDFMVSIDIYINETTRHAHIILPPATGLEVAHYDLTFNVLAIRNVTRFSEPLFQKAPEAKYDWEIMEELTARLSADYDPANPPVPRDPHQAKVDLGLQAGPYQLSLDRLRLHPHGIDLGPLQPTLPQRLLTPNKTISLAPEQMLKDLPRLQKAFTDTQTDSEFSLLLIGRRHLRDNNSWMHNATRLVKGRNRCTLLIHPSDAATLGVVNGGKVSVASRVGQIEVEAEVTEKMMRGVVSLPHGYGHGRPGVQMDVAQAHAGVSLNDLTDELFMDELTGNAAFCGLPVQVEALEEVAV